MQGWADNVPMQLACPLTKKSAQTCTLELSVTYLPVGLGSCSCPLYVYTRSPADQVEWILICLASQLQPRCTVGCPVPPALCS